MPPSGLNWVEDVLSEVSHVETPRPWIWWSLVGAVSAAAGNNYYLRSLKGTLNYKPNLYIMLLGESGLGKGFGINLSKLLVQSAKVTRVIAGRSSIQAIVTEMAKSQTNQDGSPMIKDARCYIVNGELSSAIIADVDSLAILTDLYDGHYNPEWTNMLKISGKETLKDPCVTALFGSSPAHFYDSIPAANIEGGYIGRNLIVFEEKRFQDVDLLDSEDDVKIDDRMKEYLLPTYTPHLKRIASTKGQIIPSDSARILFNNWRRKWRETQIPDKTGFINRVPDHVLKVAMCLCLAEYNSNGYISEINMATSIEQVTRLIYANRMTTEGRGLDHTAAQSKMVINILLRSPEFELTRKQLLGAGHGNFDIPTLDRIIETLKEMGWVMVDKTWTPSGVEYVYKLSGEPLENYKVYLKARENK